LFDLRKASRKRGRRDRVTDEKPADERALKDGVKKTKKTRFTTRKTNGSKNNKNKPNNKGIQTENGTILKNIFTP
jgi:hypothetical protein